jgi:hypothetical protein
VVIDITLRLTLQEKSVNNLIHILTGGNANLVVFFNQKAAPDGAADWF